MLYYVRSLYPTIFYFLHSFHFNISIVESISMPIHRYSSYKHFAGIVREH